MHQLAEHVLATAQYAETGRIRLKYTAGGFETLHPLRGNRRIGIVNGQLVITDDAGTHATPLTTLRAAAELIGITAGLPTAAYPATTPLAPDAPLSIDVDDARLLADWYGIAETALRNFGADVGADSPQPILWPEHFDLGITVDAVNYGASPGDEHVSDPYLYVGPHGGPPRRDSFWNAEFGAVRTIHEVASADDAVAFFHRGRALTNIEQAEGREQ